MDLNIGNNGYGISAFSAIAFGYMNFFYEFDMPIKQALSKAKEILISEMLENIDEINGNNDISLELKENYINEINDIINNKLNSSVDDFLSCFDKIEIVIEDICVLENIEMIIEDINIPIVLNVKALPEEYLLENIDRLDSNIRKKHSNKITYLIKPCLDESITNGEDNTYSIDEVKLVLTTIIQLTNLVKNFDLSPLEQVMYVYDIVKDHYYEDSAPGGSYLESRDVAKILKSDKIVCLGFASLFQSFLDKLGISNEVILLEGDNGSTVGHARNLVSIIDPKYNLNQLFYFDATCDCKRNDNDIDDVNRYNFFAKSRLFTLKADYKKLIDPVYMDYYLRSDNDYSFLFDGSVTKKLREIKNIFKKIDWKQYFINIDMSEDNLKKTKFLMSDDFRAAVLLSKDYDFCEFIYKECCKMLNKKLADDVFLRCLYTVRRTQHYVEPDKYSVDYDELIDTYENYTGLSKNNEYKIIKNIFGRGASIYNKIYNKLSEFEKQDTANSREKLFYCLGTLNNNMNNLELDNNTSVKEAIKILKK